MHFSPGHESDDLSATCDSGRSVHGWCQLLEMVAFYSARGEKCPKGPNVALCKHRKVSTTSLFNVRQAQSESLLVFSGV